MEEIEDNMFADLIKAANEAQNNRIKETPQEPQVCSIDNPDACEACGS